MAAGVPIPRGVSGIAMGLILGDKDDFVVLSDIAGLEDHFGDMDFKVAGTEKRNHCIPARYQTHRCDSGYSRFCH